MKIAQAFVLGAGLGTRLRPLTDDLPKPLVPIFNKSLITFALDHLMAAGVESFVVNTHHLSERFTDSLGQGGYRRCPLTLVHEKHLLETGGGIKNAERFLNPAQPFFVYSGDILTDLPLTSLIEEHFRKENDVTLALRSTGVARNVAFQNGRVVDFGQRRGLAGNYDYANISLWSRTAFQHFSLGEKISFVPVLADWIGKGGRIGGVVIEEGQWFNLTSPNDYLHVHQTIAEQHWRPNYLAENDWPERISPQAQLASNAQINGWSAVDSEARVGSDAVVEDSIIWHGAQIASCARLKRCIVRSHRQAEGTLADTII
ncbi:MAG TPA: NDP-sugar synthase [Chthoniobacterales bacterium]|jgi:NDP-sugar pyrophosphorylase family protein